MRLSTERMYERMLASDASWDGRFFTGVLTTGIYCLPSCRARKPKRENVKFFPTCEAARAAGLRPCRKCHPDDYARGSDPLLEDTETLVCEMRAKPPAFPNVAAIVRRSGFGTTRVFELFRRHYHSTPADVLVSARMERSKRDLLNSNAGLTDIAANAGFESQSTFHDQFRRVTGLTPAGFRALRESRRFTVSLPRGYCMAQLRRALSRDPNSASERLKDNTFTAAIRLSGAPALLTLQLADDEVAVEISSGSAVAAHSVAVGMLGLDVDPSGFVKLARKLGLERLVEDRPELRISRTPGVYDGLLWSIIGQQVNFAFACVLKRRLFEKYGEPIGGGLHAPPAPETLASLSPAELTPLQFSTQKAEYVIGISRLIADGTLDIDALRSMSATRVERTLLGVRGLGPWAVNYVMMRALGFSDCVPLGDTGVTSGLTRLFGLDQRPDADATRRLMEVFSPYRSLATAHLWNLNATRP